MWGGRCRGGRCLSIGRWCWVPIGTSCWAGWPRWPAMSLTPVPVCCADTPARRARPRSCSPAKAPNGPAWAQNCMRHFPVFAEAFDAVVAELDRHLARPLLEVLWGDDADLLSNTEFAQPALFAVEVALFRLLHAWGLRPDFVMGHSVG